MIVYRPATPAEARELTRNQPEHVRLVWSLVAAQGGEILAHAFISDIQGTTWLHDFMNDTGDERISQRLLLAGRRFLKSEGRTHVMTHVGMGSETHKLYIRHGFMVTDLVMRGDI